MKSICFRLCIMSGVLLAATFPGCGRSTAKYESADEASEETATPDASVESTAPDVGVTPPVHRPNRPGATGATSVTAHSAPLVHPVSVIPDIGPVPFTIGSGNFNGHREPVIMRSPGPRLLRVSPDGQFVATVRQLNRTGALLQIRDIASGQLQHEWHEPSGITTVAFAPAGNAVAWGSGDHNVVVQSLDSKPASRWPAHQHSIGDIAFSSDGNWLASVGHDNRLLIWNITRATIAAESTASTKKLALQVRFVTPSRLWTRSADGNVHWYDFTGDQLNLSTEVKLPEGFVVLATDGEKFYGTSPNRSLRMIDASTGGDLPVPQPAAVEMERYSPWTVAAVSTRSRDFAMITSGTSLTLWPVGDPSRSLSWDFEVTNVSELAADQDGRVWVASSNSNELRVFDRERPDVIRRIDLEPHTVPNEGVSPCFSPDGSSLAWLENATTVAISEIATGMTHRRILRPAPPSGMNSSQATVIVAGHRNEVLCGTSDGFIEFLNPEAHASASTVSLSDTAVTALAASSDGQYVVAGDAGGSTAWIDRRTASLVKSSRVQNRRITAIDVSPDCRTAVTASKDQTVVLWNVATQSPSLTLSDFTHAVQAVKFSPSGEWLVCGDANGTVSLRSVASGQEIWSTTLRVALTQPSASWKTFADKLSAAFQAGSSEGDSNVETSAGIVRVAFSRDQRVLAVGTAGSYTQTIDLVHRKLLASVFHQLPIADLIFAPDGASLLVAKATGDVSRWWRAPNSPLSLSGHQGSVRFAALDASGHRAVTGGVDGQLNVWNVDQGTQIQSIANEGEAIVSGALSPDGRRAVSGGYGSGVVFWDLGGMKRISKRYGHKGRVWSFAFSPDGNTVASGGDDQTVKLWDFATQKILRTLDHDAPVRFARFSPDAERLVTCTIDPRGWEYPARLRLWETDTGKPLVEYRGHHVAVNAAVFSHDGQEMTSCDADGQILRWKVLTGERIDKTSRTSGLSHAGLIGSGQCLVMRRFNDGLLIDSAESLTQLAKIDVPTLAVCDMNVASDGDRIIVGTEEGVVYVWSIGHD